MQPRIIFSSTPFGRPERILTGVFAVLLVLLGLAFGAMVIGVTLIAGLGLAARSWWLRRRLSREARPPHQAVVIDGEYQVLARCSASHDGGESERVRPVL